MNLHHVELFYYVAKHGGISRAVRHIPYGIQQPAVSAQILRLEQDLGAKLFERQPFRLTAEGQELFDFARPFFEQAEDVARRLKNHREPLLRIAASELILRDYLPGVIDNFRRQHPGVRFGLRSGAQAEFESWLQDGKIDLAIAALERKLQPGIKSQKIVALPLVLLVPKASKLKNAAELWSQRRIEEPLIIPPAGEVIARGFRRGLRDMKVEWATTIEASSTEVVAQFVANGYGIGVATAYFSSAKGKVRTLALPGFEQIEIATLWRPPVTPVQEAFRALIQKRAGELWPA